MPWRNVDAARSTLSHFADAAAGPASTSGVTIDPAIDRRHLAAWLIRNDLAGIAYTASAAVDPLLSAMLKPAAAGIAAESMAHFGTLEAIERRFQAASIPMVLLKGAAIADWAYRDRSLRAMSDIDIWVRHADMASASQILGSMRFVRDSGLADRPDELQQRSEGEVGFIRADRGHGRVELHYGAFQGWWARRAARTDSEALWRRAETTGPGRHARRLAVDDAILHASFHTVVNQLGQAPLRALMDVAVLARTGPVDWDRIVAKARDWRLSAAVWLVLGLGDRLFRLPGAEHAIAQLRPSRARRSLLRGLVSPGAILAGRDLRITMRRHAFMLAVVDRPRDVARLVGRTVWPERWWIDARYGRPVSRAEHVFMLLRRRAV